MDKIWLNALVEAAELQDLHRALVHQWGLCPLEEKRTDWDAILDELDRRVAFLLQHDFERLMSCMYAIDISEQRFSEAVKLPEKDKPARAIAQLILEREIEKMESRRRYTPTENTSLSARLEGRPPATEEVEPP